MKIQLRLITDIIVLTILLAIFGDIYGHNPFEALSIYLMLLSVTYFSAIIVTLPLSSFAYSFSAIKLAICLLVAAIICQGIWGSPEIITVSEQFFCLQVPIDPSPEMGNHPQAEWSFILTDASSNDHAFKFTGTTKESIIALRLRIEKWNREHPDCHIISHFRILEYIPIEHVKKHNYPIECSRRY